METKAQLEKLIAELQEKSEKDPDNTTHQADLIHAHERLKAGNFKAEDDPGVNGDPVSPPTGPKP